MVLGIVWVAAVVGLLLLKARRSRAAWGVLVADLLLVWFAGSAFLASLLLGPLQAPFAAAREPAWGRRNAILVLGAGNLNLGGQVRPSSFGYGRIAAAARLYRTCRGRGLACKVLVSGGDPRGDGASEAAVYGRLLADLGVARDDLVLEERSRNTFQNAQFSAPLLRAGGYDHVLLVTSGFHLARAQRFLDHFGVEAEPVAADLVQPAGSLLPSSYNLALVDLALNEHLGRGLYRVYTWTGRNPPRETQRVPAPVH